MVSAWSALALVGSFELLMLLICKHRQADAEDSVGTVASQDAPALAPDEPPAVPSLEQTVRERHTAATANEP